MIAVAKNLSDSCVLGNSVRGLRWSVADVDLRIASAITQSIGVPEIVAIVMYNRGVRSIDDAQHFLSPSFRHFMTDPFVLKDMDKASSRIADAIALNQRIAIFGDYDVDGATSSAMLKKFFDLLGVESEVYIPNRTSEGYGPTAQAFEYLINKGNNLIITVDCGTLSFDAINYASTRKIDVIVLDHHLASLDLPNAYAIVNPNRLDDDFPQKSIAAVGVAFLTLIAVRSVLRLRGYFQNSSEPDLMQYLDLVALGTVCDVIKLTGINRVFVTHGLKLMQSRNNIGIAAISDVAKIDSKIQSYHLGFVIGPRINAGGRVGLGSLGSELLYTNNQTRAMEIAMELEQLNHERRTLEAVAFSEAIEKINQGSCLDKLPVIMVASDNWHQGILGIIASRLKEKYQKPSIVMSLNDGVYKGSSRSIIDVDIGSMLANAKEDGVLLQGGGHAMAGGFSLDEEKLELFQKFCFNYFDSIDSIIEKNRDVQVDAVISLSGITGELVSALSKAGPFGAGNPQPKFLIPRVYISEVRIVCENHLMLIVLDKKYNINKTTKCMMFKAMEQDFSDQVMSLKGRTVDLIGSVQTHYRDDSKADIIVDDIIIC